MTSLLGRLLPLFTGIRRVEDLFTEAVARLFERRPDVCLGWLDGLGLVTTSEEEQPRRVRVSTQKTFIALDGHEMGSRPDLIVEISRASEDDESEPYSEIVMFESKIGSWEGPEQLRRYAEHLDRMGDFGSKTLLYVTRAYDPKNGKKIVSGLRDVEFEQLRWHDFYKFLQAVEKDALIEEVMEFMEEQGMARSYRFSTTDLMALSGVPRAFEIFNEAFGEEVQVELEAFAGNKVNRREPYGLTQIHDNKRYIMLAPIYGGNLYCYTALELETSDGYPEAKVFLEASPTSAGREAAREASVAAMGQITLRHEWHSAGLDEPTGFLRVWRGQSLAGFLSEEDHVAAVKRFFIESIRQLQEELTKFKKEHPDLPWSGAQAALEER